MRPSPRMGARAEPSPARGTDSPTARPRACRRPHAKPVRAAAPRIPGPPRHRRPQARPPRPWGAGAADRIRAGAAAPSRGPRGAARPLGLRCRRQPGLAARRPRKRRLPLPAVPVQHRRPPDHAPVRPLRRLWADAGAHRRPGRPRLRGHRHPEPGGHARNAQGAHAMDRRAIRGVPGRRGGARRRAARPLARPAVPRRRERRALPVRGWGRRGRTSLARLRARRALRCRPGRARRAALGGDARRRGAAPGRGGGHGTGSRGRRRDR